MKKVIVLLLAGFMFGCSSQAYNINGNAGEKPTKEVMQTFFVSGIGQEQELDAADICGGVDKVARVESEMSFLNGFLSSLTGGLYTPRQAKVFCVE